MSRHIRQTKKIRGKGDDVHIVSLECRNCEFCIDHTSDYMAGEKPTEYDMQAHLDIHFLARCGQCFSRNWLVTDVKPAYHPHGALDIVV